jgi:hypothetical protein
MRQTLQGLGPDTYLDGDYAVRQAEQFVHWYVGVDIGQLHDYTAASVIQRQTWSPPVRRPRYHITNLKRFELGTEYKPIVADVNALLTTRRPDGRPFLPDVTLVLDATGVGRGVLDMFKDEANMPRSRIKAITIHGGQTSFSDDRGEHHVAKKDLKGIVDRLTGEDRLKMAPTHPLGAILQAELRAFVVKVNIATGQESFEAWRERDHDGCVLSVMLPLWYAENHPYTRPALPTVLTPGFGATKVFPTVPDEVFFGLATSKGPEAPEPKQTAASMPLGTATDGFFGSLLDPVPGPAGEAW